MGTVICHLNQSVLVSYCTRHLPTMSAQRTSSYTSGNRQWSLPDYPWTYEHFRGKSVEYLRWGCEQKNIDISNETIYKHAKQPYQKALMAWYEEYEPAQMSESDDNEDDSDDESSEGIT